MRQAFLLVVSLLLLFSPTLLADDKASKEKELNRLKSRIEKLRKTIEVKETSKSSYHHQLRKIEKQIGHLGKKIRQSNQQLKKKERALHKLGIEKKEIEKSIRKHNQQLARQLHSAYTQGQQEQLKLLFSQQSAASLQRNLVYYEYCSRYRLSLIEEARKNYDRLIENEQRINIAKEDLVKILARLKTQKSDLSRDRSKRKKIIAKLNTELKKQGSHLTQLEENAQNLKQLISSLSEILIDIPPPEKSKQKFTSLRGKLAWPVKGKVKRLFGRPKPPSNLRWQGVIIQAPTGNNVRAISHGRIAFADWLRGMGNLIIIDHGNEYLSLYGHNQSLFKAAGEWVEAGDIIGSIGNSGGQSKQGLYFEIRKKGKPQNPSRWCKSSNWYAI